MKESNVPRRAALEEPSNSARRPWWPLVALLVVAALLAGALAIWRPWQKTADTASPQEAGTTSTAAAPAPTTPPAKECAPAPLIAVSQDLLEPLTQALAGHQPDGCVGAELTARADADVSQGNTAGLAGWIPTDETWLQRATPEMVATMGAQAQPFASSPLVLVQEKVVAEAMGTSPVPILGELVTGAKTWATYGQEQWGKFRLALPDPGASAVGAVGFGAMMHQVSGGAQLTDLGSGPLTPAQLAVGQLQFSVAEVTPTVEGVFGALGDQAADSRGFAQGGPRAGVVTEQAALAVGAQRPGELVAHYLPGAELRLSLGALDAERGEALTALGSYLSSEAGQAALTEAGLRTASAAPSAEQLSTVGLDAAAYVPSPVGNSVQNIVTSGQTFTSLTKRNSTIMALDISGSMMQRFGSGTRIDALRQFLAGGMALAAPGDRAGLLTFNSSPTDEMQVNIVMPLMPNNSPEGLVALGQYAELVGSVQPSGGTPLYNAIDVAYQHAIDNYDPKYSNRIVIITDGSNRDANGSMTLEQLMEKLPRGNDLYQPVGFTFVAVGPEADNATLEKLAAHTSGVALWAKTEADLTNIAQLAQFG
ncbi:MAG: VWA domain-containing protein [Propionibacteriaceae bacterium]|nr:VWA domain-containing protein [Propionibacteriaceae bacterium]